MSGSHRTCPSVTGLFPEHRVSRSLHAAAGVGTSLLSRLSGSPPCGRAPRRLPHSPADRGPLPTSACSASRCRERGCAALSETVLSTVWGSTQGWGGRATRRLHITFLRPPVRYKSRVTLQQGFFRALRWTAVRPVPDGRLRGASAYRSLPSDECWWPGVNAPSVAVSVEGRLDVRSAPLGLCLSFP